MIGIFRKIEGEKKHMDLRIIEAFIRKQKVSFICSIDENGCPNVKAMLKPRKMNGLKEFYFSTNTSSLRVKQFQNNPNASIYFYHKGLIINEKPVRATGVFGCHGIKCGEQILFLGKIILGNDGVT